MSAAPPGGEARGAREAHHPERSAQRRTPVPAGAAATVRAARSGRCKKHLGAACQRAEVMRFLSIYLRKPAQPSLRNRINLSLASHSLPEKGLKSFPSSR